MLPTEAYKWHCLEEQFFKLCRSYNFQEIRTPIFEDAELFVRSVGEDSDVVKKEMYRFVDKGGREVALRPEGTAGGVRAFLEHGYQNMPQPIKLYYYGPMFRYDRPQSGRQRQFYQMGIELFGTQDPLSDVEVIKFTANFFSGLGFENLELRLNSVGCQSCRPSYQEALQGFIRDKGELLCRECRKRSHSNPLRVLDCKVETCREALTDIPYIDQHLCPDCRAHYSAVQEHLVQQELSFQHDPLLVRGLDYYTRTAFEFISTHLGAQNSLGGGGRYDDLVELCGGPSLPGVGMAVGVERILLAMEKEGLLPEEPAPSGVFVALRNKEAVGWAQRVLYDLRKIGFRAEMDYMERGLKAQMKQANRGRFRFVLIVGGEEALGDGMVLRDMVSGEQKELSYEDAVQHLTGAQPMVRRERQ